MIISVPPRRSPPPTPSPRKPDRDRLAAGFSHEIGVSIRTPIHPEVNSRLEGNEAFRPAMAPIATRRARTSPPSADSRSCCGPRAPVGDGGARNAVERLAGSCGPRERARPACRRPARLAGGVDRVVDLCAGRSVNLPPTGMVRVKSDAYPGRDHPTFGDHQFARFECPEFPLPCAAAAEAPEAAIGGKLSPLQPPSSGWRGSIPPGASRWFPGR